REARRRRDPHRVHPGVRRGDRRGAAPRRGARLVGVRRLDAGQELPRRGLRHAVPARAQAARGRRAARQARPQRRAPRSRRRAVSDALDLTLDGGRLTAALVDVASVSGAEAYLADAVAAALAHFGHPRAERDGNAVVARTDLGRAERVVLAGHIDTVPIADNVPSRLDGGRLYGCGTSDMKSGVAVQLRLAATVARPNRDVTYVFYDLEEVEAARNGLGRLARTHPEWLAGDFAILL